MPLIAAALCVWASSAAAQSPARGVFASRTSIVLVDVVVTDEDGNAVLGLEPRDFEVFEDGARRDVVSFAAFGAKAVRPATEATAQLSPSEGPARFVLASTVLMIDEEHLGAKQTTQLGVAVGRLLQALAERGGLVLILAPRSGIAFAGRLPEDSERMAQVARHARGWRSEAITSFPLTDSEAFGIGEGDPLSTRRVGSRFAYLNPGVLDIDGLVSTRGTEVAAEATVRRRNTLGAIRLGLDWLARQPGRHSVLLLTSGFSHDRSDPSFQGIITASLEVNAPIHFLDAASLSAFNASERIQLNRALPVEGRASAFEAADESAGAERLALDTGGLRVSAADPGGLERVLATTRTYYVLGYDPPQRSKPGFRQIRVEVRARHLQVFARRGYFDAGEPARP